MSDKVILVVEDEPLVGMELKECLIRLGYSVPRLVTDGDEVLSAVEEVNPDLVLMDIRIRGSLDGIDAVAKIRETSDVPVLFLTAYSDSQTITRAAEVLPDGYLLKPFGDRELAANVELALCKSRSPLRREKSLKKLLPLIEALDHALCLFDREGRWVQGNREARKVLKIGSEESADGWPLHKMIDVSEQEFINQGKTWNGKEFSTMQNQILTLEAMKDPENNVLGYLALLDKMGRQEQGLLTDSALEVNETIQKLLPENGVFADRLDSAGFLIPTPSGTGDFYDLFPLGPTHFVFYNLDVMGHGPLPAMIVYSLRSAIRDLATSFYRRTDTVPAPSELLASLNRKFTPRSDEGQFFTITLGLIDPDTGLFSLCRAGHSQTIWMTSKGEIRFLKGLGMALGAFPEVRLEEIQGKLDHGDSLILFSDGVIDVLGKKNIEAGYSVLKEQLLAYSYRETAALSYSLRLACQSAVDRPKDDLSLFILRPKIKSVVSSVSSGR